MKEGASCAPCSSLYWPLRLRDRSCGGYGSVVRATIKPRLIYHNCVRWDSKRFFHIFKSTKYNQFVLNQKGRLFMFSIFFPFLSICKISSIILAKFCDDSIKNGWEALTSFYITNKRSLFKKRKWPYFGAFFVLWRFQGQSSQSLYLKFKLVSILHSYNEYYVISSFKSLQHSISN